MAFLSLCTVSFRNLKNTTVNTASKDIFLVGENGQGKTNFLEALYFCSYACSFRGVRDADMARSGESDFSSAATFGRLKNETSQYDFLSNQISVKIEKSKKTITCDGKKILDRKELLSAVSVVVFCHEDMEFISGSQERRRWFFDQTQSLYDPVYLDDLRKFRHVLKTRNTVLKDAKWSGESGEISKLLDVLDPQLAEYGQHLMEKRKIAAEQFSRVFSPLYREVSGIDGIRVSYVPSWKTGASQTEGRDLIITHLAERRPADLAYGITLSGPHRDKYHYVQKERAVQFSDNASTGQQRLLALLLRVAQARSFSDYTGKIPVLLLDDVLLELDGEKRRRFLSVLPEYEQAFFTFLPEEPYTSYSKSDTLVYNVRDGVIGNF